MSYRTLFVGDVHGCSTELKQLLDVVVPTRCILIGDVFRKGPDPLGVWNLVMQWNLEAVLGNHELALLAESDQYPRDLVEWVEGLPLWIDGDGKCGERTVQWRAVHAGVHPFRPNDTTRAQATVMRRYPNDSSVWHPFWWQVYRQQRLIVYGHDAKRGLQDHRPNTLGLDTGCVYGNGLTGYVLETDELVHIPSRETYVEVRPKNR